MERLEAVAASQDHDLKLLGDGLKVGVRHFANTVLDGLVADYLRYLHQPGRLEDPLDTVSGTLGLVGCADTVLVLARNPQGASLYVRGRDLEEVEHAVSFSKDACRWTILGEAAKVRRSDTRGKILTVLADADETMSIASTIGIKRNAVDKQLHEMKKKGEVALVSRGRYAHPSKPPK